MTMKRNWTIRGGRVLSPAPFSLAGIVNITPDSFSDGGQFFDPEQAVQHGLALLAEGADMLDLGAESTRPFAVPVDAAKECARLLPVLKTLRGQVPDAVLSVDTFKAETARQALEAGADIINDVTGCRTDPSLLEILAQFKPGYVLMHSQGTPESMQIAPHYTNIIDEMKAFFEERLARLVQAGLPENRIVLDPGIGFGKNKAHTETLLQQLEQFTCFGLPLYVGLSRKSLFREILGLERTEDRSEATHLAVALLGARGIPYHRVHDVAGCRMALKLVTAMTPRMKH